MGIFTKETETEISTKLPTDKMVCMVRGTLKSIKYSRGKKGTEPVLIVEQKFGKKNSTRKYEFFCAEGVPPKGIEVGELHNFYSVEDVRVNTEYISVMGEKTETFQSLPVSSSIDLTFNVEGGHTIQKTLKGNKSLFEMKRTKETYYRLVGIDLDNRFH
jgi:hypothetical protein